MINLLQDLQDKLGLSYLFIAHDLSVVRHIADRVAVMYLGRIVETGDRDGVFDRPSHPYTQALISAVPVPDPRKERAREHTVLRGEIPSTLHPPAGCRFRSRCPTYLDRLDESQRTACAERVPALVDHGDVVALADPEYLFVERMLRFLGAQVVRVGMVEDPAGPQLDLRALEEVARDGVKLLYAPELLPVPRYEGDHAGVWMRAGPAFLYFSAG